jgi:hypothetical protein
MAAKEGFNPYGLIPAHPVPSDEIHTYTVKTSATIAVGDPVIIDGVTVDIAVSNSSTTLCGVAASAVSSASAGDEISVYDNPNTIFFIRCSADASAVALGTLMDLSGTTGAFVANVAASSQDLLMNMGVKRGDTSSTTGAQLKVKINASHHAFGAS